MQKMFVQLALFATGTAFIICGIKIGWGPTAVMGGVFFVTLGVMTVLLDLANVPGFWQPFLRSKGMSIFIILTIIGLMAATTVVAVLQRLGFFAR